MKNFNRTTRTLAVLSALIALAAPRAFAAVLYLDLNGTTAGFGGAGTSSNVDLTTTAVWSTSNAGTATPGLFTAAATDGLQIGVAPSDFNGGAININMSDGASIGNNPATFNIASSNCVVTLSGTAACRFNHATTIAVTNFSTLIWTDTGNNNGFNFNSEPFTFVGPGTNEFDDAFCANGNASQTENMSGGTIRLNQTKTSNFGGSANASFTLTAGTLSFMTNSALADAFAGFTTAGNGGIKINGGFLDNISGASGTLTLGSAGAYTIGGSFTNIGTSSLSLGANAVTLTVSPTIGVRANTFTIGGAIGGAFGITKTGAGTLALTGANTYSGATTVNAGGVATTTASTGGGNFVVTNASTLNVKVAVAGQSLNVNSLTLGNDALDAGTLQIDAAALGNPTAPVINATNLALNGTVTINLFGTALATGTYTILTNSPGLRTGSGSFTLVANPRFNATLNDDTANNRVTVTLNNPDSAIVWDGTASGNWDINNSGNNTWKGNNSGAATDYTESGTFGNDSVVFNDSATGTPTVNLLASTLSPNGITVSNTLATPTANYTFSGVGKISGTTGLIKNGTGALTLSGSGGDNFSGGISIGANGGTVLLDDANSTISGNTTIGSGSTLQVGNNDAGGNLPSGTVTDSGAMIFNRNDSALSVISVINGGGTLANNGPGTVALTGTEGLTGAVTVNNGTLALSGPNSAASTISASSGLTINNGGTVQLVTDNSLGNPTTTPGLPITINAGGTLTGLGSADGGAGTSSHIRGILTLNGGTLAMAGTQDNTHGSWNLDSNVVVLASSTTSTISALGVVPTQAGGTIFNVAAGTAPGGIDLLVSGALTNASATADTGIIKTGNGTMALAGLNTYARNTTIGAGTLALTGSGSIAATPNIIIAGGAAFDVSGLSSAFALGASQTLSNSTSTAVLGGDADASLGTIGLTYASGTPSLNVTNGTLTLASTTVFNVNNTGAVLPHGSYDIISIASAGNVGLVSGTVPSSVAVSGAGVTAGATPSLQISGGALNLVVPDQSPVANAAGYTHPAGQALKIALADLATNWSDPDGDAVSLSSVASPSVNGVMVTNDANYIYYTYTGADTTPDSFTYTVSDGFGGTAVGTVNVTVAGLSGTAPSIGNPGTDPVTHNPTFSGSGIPGYEYGVESETSLSGPWANAGADEASSTVTVRNDGSWSFTNSTPSPGTIFFRLYYPYSATPPN